MRQYGWRLTCLVLLVLGIGCSSANETTAVQGDVKFEGSAVERGKIVFIPVDGTNGPSAGANIGNGRYAVPGDKWGLLSDGVYLVRITAVRKTGRMEPPPPNMARFGAKPVEQEENFIPAIYNSQSTLKVRVSDLPDKTKVDFLLGKTPAGGRRP